MYLLIFRLAGRSATRVDTLRFFVSVRTKNILDARRLDLGGDARAREYKRRRSRAARHQLAAHSEYRRYDCAARGSFAHDRRIDPSIKLNLN